MKVGRACNRSMGVGGTVADVVSFMVQIKEKGCPCIPVRFEHRRDVVLFSFWWQPGSNAFVASFFYQACGNTCNYRYHGMYYVFVNIICTCYTVPAPLSYRPPPPLPLPRNAHRCTEHSVYTQMQRLVVRERAASGAALPPMVLI